MNYTHLKRNRISFTHPVSKIPQPLIQHLRNFANATFNSKLIFYVKESTYILYLYNTVYMRKVMQPEVTQCSS